MSPRKAGWLVLLSVVMLASAGFAQTQSITIGSQSVTAGSTALLPVNVVANLGAGSLAGINLRLVYESAITSSGATAAGSTLLHPADVLDSYSPAGGTLNVVAYAPTSGSVFLGNSGTAFTLQFQTSAAAAPGTVYHIGLAATIVGPPDTPPCGISDALGSATSGYTYNFTTGTITILAAATPSPTPTTPPSPTPSPTPTAGPTPVLRTLSVGSQNPDSLVPIAVSPLDHSGLGDGITAFTRTYVNGSVAQLSAPALAPNNNEFVKWLKNGADFPNNTVAVQSVTMNADVTMLAIYQAPFVPGTTCTLTIQSSPDSGVTISAAPADLGAHTGVVTPGTLQYISGTTVTLQAPLTAVGKNFLEWDQNGAYFATSAEMIYTVTTDTVLTAVYTAGPLPAFTVTVDSTPNHGVTITATPLDNNSLGDGTTLFTRLYNQNTVVALTAPTVDGASNAFIEWRVDGVAFGAGARTINYPVTTTATLMAVYNTPVITYTLTVNSANPASGVSITVSPNDNGGNGSGPTPFTRTYNSATVVALTAPASASGNNFVQWNKNGVLFGTALAANVSMTANMTMAAVYVTSTTPPTTGTAAIALYDGATPIASGGEVIVGTAKIAGDSLVKTLTIVNPGGAPLTVSNLVLPAGFTGALPTAAIAAGSSATMTVTLATTNKVLFGGIASFATNVAKANPFKFNLIATVSEAVVVKVQALRCTATATSGPVFNLKVTGTGPTSDLKLIILKGSAAIKAVDIPAKGITILRDCSGITNLSVEGSLRNINTAVPIIRVDVSGDLASLTAAKTAVGEVFVGGILKKVVMTQSTDATVAETPQQTVIVSTGALLRGNVVISLNGVGAQRIEIPNSPVIATLSAKKKKGGIVIGSNVGLVKAGSALTLTATGSDVVGPILVNGEIKKVKAALLGAKGGNIAVPAATTADTSSAVTLVVIVSGMNSSAVKKDITLVQGVNSIKAAVVAGCEPPVTSGGLTIITPNSANVIKKFQTTTSKIANSDSLYWSSKGPSGKMPVFAPKTLAPNIKVGGTAIVLEGDYEVLGK
ncbi:MAG: hypothetical protein NTX50_30405 [Candidatus Sumerlaeota bacterium]|nr:hypothetical protein [Candidatus Sumerlaeota bacterium]